MQTAAKTNESPLSLHFASARARHKNKKQKSGVKGTRLSRRYYKRIRREKGHKRTTGACGLGAAVERAAAVGVVYKVGGISIQLERDEGRESEKVMHTHTLVLFSFPFVPVDLFKLLGVARGRLHPRRPVPRAAAVFAPNRAFPGAHGAVAAAVARARGAEECVADHHRARAVAPAALALAAAGAALAGRALRLAAVLICFVWFFVVCGLCV